MNSVTIIVPGKPLARKAHKWTDAELCEFKRLYPQMGKKWCIEHFGLSEAQIRSKAFLLGLRQDRSSEFFSDWQGRAAKSKVGKKRPEQRLVILKCHADGKLKKNDEQRRAISIRTKKWIKEHGHPKGATGMNITDEHKRKISESSKAMWANKNHKVNTKEYRQKLSDRMKNNQLSGKMRSGYTRSAGGTRSDLGIYVRSAWEANIARYLNFLKSHGEIKDWDYEKVTFEFVKIKRGCRSYTPDFRVFNNDGSIYFIEVKGWMDQKSKTKLSRMKRYYPQVKLDIIDEDRYKSIAKSRGIIPGWETCKRSK